MTPEEARSWVAGREVLGMRFGTDRMSALLAALGDPHRRVPALQVVGTNGKSSTARLAAAALGAHGLRVGAYTSPHVTDWHERIQLDGAPIGPEAFARVVTRVRDAAERLPLPEGDVVTQFEALTAAAFVAFADAGAAAVVVEAGLGGRYDATNVLAPDAAVILTNVSLDHTDLLGDTLGAIAGEKLAVCAAGHERLVIGPCTPAARAAVADECARRGLRPEWVGRDIDVAADGPATVRVTTPRGDYPRLPLRLAGDVQRGNLAAALAGAEMAAGGALPPDAVARAVAGVRMPGRMELVPGAPAVLLDGAHNPEGVAALARALPALAGGRRPRVGLVSVLSDKDVGAMMEGLAGALDAVVATGSHHGRALPAATVAARARAAGLDAEADADPLRALERARARAGADGLVVVCGSLYLLVDVRPAIAG